MSVSQQADFHFQIFDCLSFFMLATIVNRAAASKSLTELETISRTYKQKMKKLI